MNNPELKRRMYNPELKRQYIDYAMSVSTVQDAATFEKSLINRFIRAEPLEKEFGKDILYMSQEELKLFLGKFLRGGKSYQEHTLSKIRSYCEWGIKNGYCSLNTNWMDGLKLRDINISRSYADTMVSSEEDLFHVLNSVLTDIDRDTPDNIIRCICVLLFAGVPYNDIWYLKTEDVDLDTKSIICKNRTIPLSEDIYKVVKHNMDMKKMLIIGRGTIAEQLLDIMHEGFLIANTKEYFGDRGKMKKTYDSTFPKKLSQCTIRDLTSTTIYNSGVFCRIYSGEKETGKIDYTEYLWARRNHVVAIEWPERIKAKCEYEYRLWKDSFNLR